MKRTATGFIVTVVFLMLRTGGAAAQLRPRGAALTLEVGDERVGTYVSSPKSFTTSSYWIEGPEGLVIIDTQFLPSAAIEMVTWAEKVTGKKAKLAIVLHPNPDKFNGTTLLHKRGIKVVTSAQVAALIPEVHKDRHHWFYDRYKPDYPDQAPAPQSFGDRTRELRAAGLTLKLHVLPGPGCSGAHVAVEWQGHLFTGDLVANNHHAWLEIGKTDEWLARLAELAALKPEYVHPGRGPNGGSELLERQALYLRRVIERVAAARKADPAATPGEAAVEKLKATLTADYPGYGNDYFLDIGLPAEWERQVKASPAGAPAARN